MRLAVDYLTGVTIQNTTCSIFLVVKYGTESYTHDVICICKTQPL